MKKTLLTILAVLSMIVGGFAATSPAAQKALSFINAVEEVLGKTEPSQEELKEPEEEPAE